MIRYMYGVKATGRFTCTELKPNSITLAGSEVARNMLGASSELAPNMFGASLELAPSMFGASSELVRS